MHMACINSLTRDQTDAFGSESAESGKTRRFHTQLNKWPVTP